MARYLLLRQDSVAPSYPFLHNRVASLKEGKLGIRRYSCLPHTQSRAPIRQDVVRSHCLVFQDIEKPKTLEFYLLTRPTLSLKLDKSLLQRQHLRNHATLQ